MAAISILKSGNYLVQIRVRNLKHISGTFTTKQQADIYILMIESQIASIFEAENSKLPVDMTALDMKLHPDLKDAAQHLPVFTRLIGNIASHELTLSRLIDDFMYNYDKKDNNILNRLKWWSNHYGHISIKEISEDHIRQIC